MFSYHICLYNWHLTVSSLHSFLSAVNCCKLPVYSWIRLFIMSFELLATEIGIKQNAYWFLIEMEFPHLTPSYIYTVFSLAHELMDFCIFFKCYYSHYFDETYLLGCLLLIALPLTLVLLVWDIQHGNKNENFQKDDSYWIWLFCYVDKLDICRCLWKKNWTSFLTTPNLNCGFCVL